ncbi:MAG TPA: M48 family metalloprotease, partial [Flavisolibacter sp.]
MWSALPILAVLLFTASCNFVDREETSTKTISYSYACLDSAVGGSTINRTLDKTTGIIRDLAISSDSITDEVQTEYGDAFHQDAIETKTFVLLKDPKMTSELQEVMDELLASREKPSRIRYTIYALNDTLVNAFTFGGRIYVTKGMYEKCGGKTPLLYSIIGHEIGHSEKGHIKRMIQEMELSNQIF